ncbi:MAG: MBL fold metallo-hydrolase [Candidatus Melainabacteria bacterium]|nr:MBL fold metallo-hydrolase [Candidatus Melainabacteria bacterium]
MADRKKIVKENIAGNFFVDTTCIDCDTCRQLAPASFKDAGDYSYVFSQPITNEDRRDATRALLACPTGSIGCDENNIAKEVIEDFPLLIEDNVYYCGFNSPKSYGGNAYFIEDPDGNWLIDSPKFNSHLVKEFEKRGGLKYIFLTHEDDVAESDRFAQHFDAKRIIHKAAQQACRDAEIILEDHSSEISLPADFEIIQTPGHTRGHIVLLYKNKYLFTGDHLAYNRHSERLTAFREHCWYSWEVQAESMQNLANYDFEWILPGHGGKTKLEPGTCREQVAELAREMASA